MIFRNGTSGYEGRRKPPRVFTEQGVSMLSSVLRGKVAININIQIIQMRRYTLTHDEQIEDLNQRVSKGGSNIYEADGDNNRAN